MDSQNVGSPRATDSPRRLPDNGPTPLSPRTAVPRVFTKQYEALLVEMGKSDSLCQTVFILGSFIDEMSSAIAQECAKAGMPAKAQGMQKTAAQISNALGQVDTLFDQTDFANCLTYLVAAKTDQVLLLAAIDGLKQDPDGDQEFSKAHDQCVQLGHKITALSQLVNDKLRQQQQQQQQQKSPRTSSPRFLNSPEKHRNQKTKRIDASLQKSSSGQHTPRSPESATERARLEKMPSPTSGKRAQGDEDSPHLKDSPAKRHKAQVAENTVSSPSHSRSDATIPALGTKEANPRIAPGNATKVPRLDWSSAKPVSSGPQSPLGTTPRTAKHTRTESKGTENPGVSNAATSSAPAYDARIGTDRDEHPSSTPTSPFSLRSDVKQASPRKSVSSPSRQLKQQPRPRPPSMLFMSPPVPSGSADQSETIRNIASGNDSDSTPLQGPPSTPHAASNINATTTTTTTTIATNAGQLTPDKANA